MNFKEQSFTLIELLVVISIIGLLGSIVLASLGGAKDQADIAKAQAFSHTVRTSLGADLVGEWRLDNNTNDSSGYNNNGTVGGDPSYIDGMFGDALEFDSGNDHVRAIDPVSLRVQTHTVEFWIKFNSIAAGSWRPVLQKHGGGSNRAPGIWRNRDHPQRLHWKYHPGNLGFSDVGPKGEGTDFDTNEWYHVVGVKEGAIFSLYVNGEFTDSIPVPETITQGSGDFYLGGSSSAPAAALDEVRIYNKALVTAEIEQLYAQGAANHGIVLK